MEISANAFNSGLSGIQAGQRRVEQAAGEIAGNAVGQAPQTAEQTRPDLTESLLALRVGENEVRASARVVASADEVLGTLIDTRA